MMTNRTVVPLPEGYHAFVGRATKCSGTGRAQLRALRVRRGATVGVAGREGLAGMVVARMAVMVTRDGQTWGPE